MRRLPSVGRLLQHPAAPALQQAAGREALVEGLRWALDQAREHVRAGGALPSDDDLLATTGSFLDRQMRPTLTPVVNATGVIIHTNLGRAPLSDAALAAMQAAGQGYSNLEYALEAGQRGSRYVHTEDLLCRLTGAEAALVVNNNAGAVLLVLSALAQGREVIISRSQLIEIGGGFRIPDVMRQSGAHLVEVGTTNRTRADDYRRALSERTALLMRAHHSNFQIVGFTEEASLVELAALGQEAGLPLYEDLGSGTLLPTEPYGLAHEPTVPECVAQGADLISFSGDKLLGGPQAGIIVGRKELVAGLRRFPLTRALRVDKTTLAGLQATLLHYLRGEAAEAIPVWQMMAAPLPTLGRRARRWARQLAAAGLAAKVLPGRSAVGGGSLPGQTLPTTLLALAPPSPDRLARRLRLGAPPVVARIEEDHLVFDPRTVPQRNEAAMLRAILEAWKADGQDTGD
ncbi:MAG: L-seryl-tRNA(Sec) selenium transferase [Chloroflexi bacterium]|nr:L-seryl-tRNA(Sec) selenium transferase [Chloroflexota bacterium]